MHIAVFVRPLQLLPGVTHCDRGRQILAWQGLLEQLQGEVGTWIICHYVIPPCVRRRCVRAHPAQGDNSR